MRDIKFRAKPIENESKYNGWLYGNLIHITENYSGEEDFKEVDDWYIGSESGIEFEIQAETIGQYTGLKDKNGTEIYEGDILRNYDNEIEDWFVSYEYGKFVGTFDNICEDLYELSDLEVIGNIYDNLELLEEETKDE